MSTYKRNGQIDVLIEFNVYGTPDKATNDDPMFIGRVVTVGSVRGGFEPIANFATSDDGAQYSAYVEEIKLRAARFDIILDTFREYGEQRTIEQIRRFVSVTT